MRGCQAGCQSAVRHSTFGRASAGLPTCRRARVISEERPGLNATVRAEPTVARVAPERLLVINPLEYPNWDSLIFRHRESPFFYCTAWARVLHETYGHSPFYFCSLADKHLCALLP